jgi:predicted membrane-bound spermidine synthase
MNQWLDERGLGLPRPVLLAVFTVSGICALLYQLIWQRALLLIYGSNIESVTMVVSAFMLGLGLGSLLGGAISKRPGVPLLFLFGCVEILIGLYGAISLQLFEAVGEATGAGSTLTTGVLCFVLVLVPTLLMGSTLPLLVAHYVNASGNVGYSVSMLYFVNTLGAGLGAFLAVFVILGALGLQMSVVLAVALNLLAGATILVFWKKGGQS